MSVNLVCVETNEFFREWFYLVSKANVFDKVITDLLFIYNINHKQI